MLYIYLPNSLHAALIRYDERCVQCAEPLFVLALIAVTRSICLTLAVALVIGTWILEAVGRVVSAKSIVISTVEVSRDWRMGWLQIPQVLPKSVLE